MNYQKTTKQLYQLATKGLMTVSLTAVVVTAIATSQQTSAVQSPIATDKTTPAAMQPAASNPIRNFFEDVMDVITPPSATPAVVPTPITPPVDQTPAPIVPSTPAAPTTRPVQTPQPTQSTTTPVQSTQPTQTNRTSRTQAAPTRSTNPTPVTNAPVIEATPAVANPVVSDPQLMSQSENRGGSIAYTSSSLSPERTTQGYIIAIVASAIGIGLVLFAQYGNGRNTGRTLSNIRRQKFTSSHVGSRG